MFENRSWKRLLQAASTKPTRRVRRPVPLSVELLEAREVPTATPYLLPVDPSVTTRAILTVGDVVPLTGTTTGQTYRMVGVPDGLGAFDNGDGTFTLLMNHELLATQGVTRAHGSNGAF